MEVIMTTEKFMNDFWHYYLILEEKFINTTKYVELSDDDKDHNYDTYSMEFVIQLQTICSEIDVVMKEISGFLPSNKRKCISDYAPIILENFPNIINQNIKINGKMIKLQPFEGWNISQASKSLPWWESYSNIKHGRVENFKKANLKNVLYSLSALFILERLWLIKIASNLNGEMDIPNKTSSIFELLNYKSRYMYSSDSYLEEI